MGLPSREAWELARQVTIAPLREGETGGTLSGNACPSSCRGTDSYTVLENQATQTQQQLEGARAHERG
jgi:hypothetical protein